ncbi:MAG TPA: bifunctional oligoribonuclease/PAP phosphatase NrnA [Terriglobales bacterium]|nr:bifunctional oligoribonuclease/PAP phosphatase NrnA [Terriglobales bacterium]
MLQEVLKSIDQRRDFVLTSHARPDGDAIGSVLAAGQMLRELGKRVDIVMSDGVPIIYHGLPTWETIQHKSQVNGGYEAALILECDSVKRTGVEGLDEAGRFIINIDHHTSAKPFGHVNWIDTRACATAEMIFELGKAAGVKITPEIATCLYTAVLTDTGSFCFQGTNEKTFLLAQELVQAGADPARIAQRVYFANPESKMRLLGCALGSLRRHGKLAWMFVTQPQMEQCGAKEEDCEGLVNYALGIADVEVALFFREIEDGRFRVSLRSKGAVDVSKIAEQFGGGGHMCASGCSMAGPLGEATERLIHLIEIDGSPQQP